MKTMILRINISARNSNELIDALKRVDISVPSRSEGQNSEFRERWSMYRLLATLCKIDVLDFPVICNHEDKPDFYLLNGTNEIGVECTDAIHEDYAHAESISEKYQGSVTDPDFFRVGERKSAKEIHDIARRAKLTGPGWDGDESEREWAKGILKTVDDKTKKLREKEFRKYPKNGLLIFDGLNLHGLVMSKAFLELKTKLDDYWSSKDKIFDTIFIERSSKIYQFCSEGTKELSIANIWASIQELAAQGFGPLRSPHL